MTTWSDILRDLPLVAILRGVRPTEAAAIAEALYAAGWRCVETPLNSPDPLASIEAIAQAFAGRMLVGAGTVLSPGQAKDAAAAGAQFIVSPNVDAEVIGWTKSSGLIAMPGAFTATEAFSAIAAGAHAVKLQTYTADTITAVLVGANAVRKPSLAASFRRASRWPTARTSPPSPISPNTTMSAGTGVSASDEISAAATARSAAGSAMRRPPATLR